MYKSLCDLLYKYVCALIQSFGHSNGKIRLKCQHFK